jgi:hypothetical protein
MLDGFIGIVYGFAFDGDTIAVFFVSRHVDGAELTLSYFLQDIIIVHNFIVIKYLYTL